MTTLPTSREEAMVIARRWLESLKNDPDPKFKYHGIDLENSFEYESLMDDPAFKSWLDQNTTPNRYIYFYRTPSDDADTDFDPDLVAIPTMHFPTLIVHDDLAILIKLTWGLEPFTINKFVLRDMIRLNGKSIDVF